ncbi:MAG TPA: aspartate-semialdehyde dehydrogenase [Candidatus Acidoferrales bacterium]|nr:aspartate-semialdehyde dehydrogenase [Candidatus Acidoferrales bacterium]
MNSFRVGVLGATGTVGQQIIHRLRAHPWFCVTALAASGRSAGKCYADAAPWRIPESLPREIGALPVRSLDDELDCDFIFSALDSSVAGDAEENFARRGYAVISNSSNHRMDVDVPLIVPEVNPDHVALVEAQRARRGYTSGFIVTNPNCSAAGLVIALKPIDDAFGVEAVSVVTMQALSGAGYPGVASLDAADNVIPFISAEEEKLESEPRKILGTLRGNSIAPAEIRISAQCHRVPVSHGHLEAVSLKLRTKASPEDIAAVLREFRGEPQRLEPPSAPAHPIEVREEPDRPQPRLDRDAGNGMTVVVGRVRRCPVFDIRFVLLSHNLVRGAAGAAILNAEFLTCAGAIVPRTNADPPGDQAEAAPANHARS